ncbi:hypothetical protein BofuT4_uP068020.1 [Botrytis cinerea T4]|uniref:Uncharacterized protein n=1 Tax=Botryotinia fuckeliana (strain T4) TaxID=999810 RepID=G2XQW9_BOTF4|nr:hypothetical protein BofuT4_uP068020.1 [Botrytis cinerea T4]
MPRYWRLLHTIRRSDEHATATATTILALISSHRHLRKVYDSTREDIGTLPAFCTTKRPMFIQHARG